MKLKLTIFKCTTDLISEMFLDFHGIRGIHIDVRADFLVFVT